MSEETPGSVDRRSFVRTAAAISALPLVTPVWGGLQANDRIKVGLVGCGGRGSGAAANALNADPGVDGILVQSPLPKHLDEVAVFRRVAPHKDVDGFNTLNLGKVAQEDDTGFVSCTPAGIMELLARSGVDLKGKHVVVLGRSLIVGKPIALLALQKRAGANGTVTICHSGTSNLPAITRQADVLIAAIGRPDFVTADMIKPGVVVIDVGINRVADATKKSGYRLTGDVHFASVAPLAAQITPVPGGVGPMTVAMLMKNTVKARKAAL